MSYDPEAMPVIAPAIANATWAGDSGILDPGSPVEILAVDDAGRYSGSGIHGVPARAACWIRHWPDKRWSAQYRSCDLADLDISDEDWDRIAARKDTPNG